MRSRRAVVLTLLAVAVLAAVGSVTPILPALLVLSVLAAGVGLASPWHGLVLVVSASFLLPTPFSFHVAGTSLTVSRLLFGAVLVGWLAQRSVVRHAGARPRTPFDVALCLLLGAVVLSAIANLQEMAPFELAGALRSVATVVFDYFLPFFLTVAVVAGAGRSDRLLRIMAGLGFLTAGLGVIEFATHQNVFQFLHPILPASTNKTIATEAGASVLVRSGFFRVHSTFEQPLVLGTVLLLILPVAMWLVFAAESRRARLGWSAGVLLMVSAMLFTASRAVYLLLVLTILLVTLLCGHRGVRKTLVLLSAGLVVLAISVPAVRNQVSQSFHNRPGTQVYGSYQHRLHDVAPVLHLVAERPVLGYGPRTFAQDELDRSHRLAPPANDVLDDAYLGQAAETGIAGLSMLVLVLVTALVAAGRSVRRAATPVARLRRLAQLAAVFNFVVMGLIADVYTFNAPPRIFFVLLGVLAADLVADGWPHPAPSWVSGTRGVPAAAE